MNLFYSLLTSAAKEAGFSLFGALDLEPCLRDPNSVWKNHVRHLDEWLVQGYSGEMEYILRGRDRRADPRLLFPAAKSVFCVAESYLDRNGASSAALREKNGPRFARYLKGEDYHRVLSRRLEEMMQKAASAWQAASPDCPLQWKVCVDTSAVLERSLAALAGLGWIAKNTLLTHPKQGSFLFLAEVFLSEETGEEPKLPPPFCGHCNRCLEACPTGALLPVGFLDSRHCISYLTLEKRGEFGVTKDVLRKMGRWVAGCDICQEVCPFNRRPLRESTAETDASSWDRLLNETESEYQVRVRGSALNRIKWNDFRRNLFNAIGNRDLGFGP